LPGTRDGLGRFAAVGAGGNHAVAVVADEGTGTVAINYARRLLDAEPFVSTDLPTGAIGVTETQARAEPLEAELTKLTVEERLALTAVAAAPRATDVALALPVEAGRARWAVIIFCTTPHTGKVLVYVTIAVVVDAVATLGRTVHLIGDADDLRLSVVAHPRAHGAAPVAVDGAADPQADEELVDTPIAVVVMVITSLGARAAVGPNAVGADVKAALVVAGDHLTVDAVSRRAWRGPVLSRGVAGVQVVDAFGVEERGAEPSVASGGKNTDVAAREVDDPDGEDLILATGENHKNYCAYDVYVRFHPEKASVLGHKHQLQASFPSIFPIFSAIWRRLSLEGSRGRRDP
jgi:hypothetical protein